jgi:hypothetical protein
VIDRSAPVVSWQKQPDAYYGINAGFHVRPITSEEGIDKAVYIDTVDEAHLVNPTDETMYRTLIEGLKSVNPYLKVIGLTATPWRLGHGRIIDDVIVPLLKEKALLGKKVIIATHDANIAVRTLPYNSIYRLHDQGQYFTLTGNPFSNSLKCIYDSRPELNWKEISMKTLEGGKEAFGERGKIYGN